jgi:hypothetical protein
LPKTCQTSPTTTPELRSLGSVGGGSVLGRWNIAAMIGQVGGTTRGGGPA